MPDATELQRVIAAAWSAGYAAREAELVCRRRASADHRHAEIARLVAGLLETYAFQAAEPALNQEQALSR
jgi:hypothetical protein